MKNTQLWGWIKVYKFFFCLRQRKAFAFVPFSKINLTTRFTKVYAYLQFNAESLKDTLLPCNWSYTCKPKSSLGFWAVVSRNLLCYVDMGLAEISLDLLGNLSKMLCCSGQPLDLSVPITSHVVLCQERMSLRTVSYLLLPKLWLSASCCCCFILLTHAALYIHIVFLINAYSSWKPDLKASFNF